MVRSLIDTYRRTGRMPDARIAGANGLTHGGSNSDVLVADALVKGLKGSDYETAYRAMVKNAEVDSPRPLYEGREASECKRRGHMSTRHERSASRTLDTPTTTSAWPRSPRPSASPRAFRPLARRIFRQRQGR